MADPAWGELAWRLWRRHRWSWVEIASVLFAEGWPATPREVSRYVLGRAAGALTDQP